MASETKKYWMRFINCQERVFCLSIMYHQAYEDNNALPIGQGQTISQPYIAVEMMNTDENGREQLRNWTRFGYQTAVLLTCFISFILAVK